MCTALYDKSWIWLYLYYSQGTKFLSIIGLSQEHMDKRIIVIDNIFISAAKWIF